MSKENCTRGGGKDVFHAFLVKNAEYDGRIELPCIKTSDKIPNRLTTFSKAMERATVDFNQWVMFYEHDAKFERLWHNPKQYLTKLKKIQRYHFPGFQFVSQYAACYAGMEYISQQSFGTLVAGEWN